MGPERSAVWDLAKQMGVNYGVFNLPNTEGDEQPWEYEPLRRMKSRADQAGLDVQVIEERPPMDDIRLARRGREEQLETVLELVRNLGRLDIPVWCWSWRTHFSVIRTGRVRLRGGSEGTAYVGSQLEGHLDGDPTAASAPQVSEAELWENVEWFLERVVPVAEEAGVELAIHPDDPPIDGDIEGTARIMTSVDAFDRLLDLYPSDYNGICLPQGNFAARGVDMAETIRHFGDDIHFVHFRDVRGTPENFYETWHDNGQTDMHAAMQAYRDVGFDGPIRPDHFPTVTAGDGDDGLRGRLHAIGYMQGLMEATEPP
jgi:mannonate dehydratase